MPAGAGDGDSIGGAEALTALDGVEAGANEGDAGAKDSGAGVIPPTTVLRPLAIDRIVNHRATMATRPPTTARTRPPVDLAFADEQSDAAAWRNCWPIRPTDELHSEAMVELWEWRSTPRITPTTPSTVTTTPPMPTAVLRLSSHVLIPLIPARQSSAISQSLVSAAPHRSGWE